MAETQHSPSGLLETLWCLFRQMLYPRLGLPVPPGKTGCGSRGHMLGACLLKGRGGPAPANRRPPGVWAPWGQSSRFS